jgi:hypothetical protein
VRAVLEKAAIFFSDRDVLVRQQATRVASHCVVSLGRQDKDKARQIVHRIWPSLVDQVGGGGGSLGYFFWLESHL